MNNKSTVKERLKEFIRYKNISQRSFLLQCGLSEGFISSMRVSLQPGKVDNIAMQFPELNIAWLMTGNGEMLVKNDGIVEEPPTEYQKKCVRCRELEERINALEDTIEAQKMTISTLQELNTELKKGKFMQTGSASA